MIDIKDQLRHYQDHLDGLYPPVPAADIRTLEVTATDAGPPRLAFSARVPIVAFAAAFLLILGLGVILFAVRDAGIEGPSDQTDPAAVSTTPVPTTATSTSPTTSSSTTVPSTTVPTTTVPTTTVPQTTVPGTTVPAQGVTIDGEYRAALGSDGLPVIAYWSTEDEALELVRCADPDCATAASSATLTETGIGVAVEGDRLAPFEISGLVLGSSGEPRVLVNDVMGGMTTLFVCMDPACTSVSTADIVSGERVERAALALAPDGAPRVAYISRSQLRLAMCGDPLCDPAAVVTLLLDSIGGDVVGPPHNPLLQVDLAGRMLITYTSGSATNPEARIAVCDDAACSGGPEILRSPDAMTPRLATDSDGSFHVWYRSGPQHLGEGGVDPAAILETWALHVVACDAGGCGNAMQVEADWGLLMAWEADVHLVTSANGESAMVYSYWFSERCSLVLRVTRADAMAASLGPELGFLTDGYWYAPDAMVHDGAVVLVMIGDDGQLLVRRYPIAGGGVEPPPVPDRCVEP